MGETHHSPGAGAGSEILLELRWGVVKVWDCSRMAVAGFTVFACGCTYMWRLEVNMGVLNHSPPNFLKQGLSLNPVFIKWLD